MTQVFPITQDRAHSELTPPLKQGGTVLAGCGNWLRHHQHTTTQGQTGNFLLTLHTKLPFSSQTVHLFDFSSLHAWTPKSLLVAWMTEEQRNGTDWIRVHSTHCREIWVCWCSLISHMIQTRLLVVTLRSFPGPGYFLPVSFLSAVLADGFAQVPLMSERCLLSLYGVFPCKILYQNEMGSFNSASRFPRGKKPFLPGKSPSSVFSFIELHLMAISCFSTGREMHDLQVKVKLPPSPSRLSNGAEFGLFPVTVVSLELYRLPHQDFSDWIDFSSGHRESQRKRKCMLSLNHVTGQDTMPPPHPASAPPHPPPPTIQLQATFGKDWNHPAVQNAKSDKKIAGFRLKTTGGLSRGPLLHYFTALRQCRGAENACQGGEQRYNASWVAVRFSSIETHSNCFQGVIQ